MRDLVMRAAHKSAPFSRRGWLFEIKFDGYRIIAYKHGEMVILRTKSGRDVTNEYPSIAQYVRELPGKQFILDGELTVVDQHGRTRLDLMRRKRHSGHLVYWVFDLLELEGTDLRSLPLRERKKHLARLLRKSPEYVRYVSHVEEKGEELFEKVCALGLEGLMAKRANAQYVLGTSDAWVKMPCYQQLRCVVIGISPHARSLMLAVPEKATFRCLGRVTHGVPAQELLAAESLLQKITLPSSPCSVSSRYAHMRWIEPLLWCVVKCKNSPAGQLREPVFLHFIEAP